MKIEDVIQFLIFGSETCNKVTLDKEDVKTLLDYITTLQRKEYNNSKAIKYNYELQERYCHSALFDDLVASKVYEIAEKNINILEKGE